MRRGLTVIALLPAASWACACLPPGPPCDAAWKASAVFVGTAVEVTHDLASSADPFLRTHVVFDVTEPFTGMEGRGKRVEVRTGTGVGDCGFGFEPGRSYVVYGWQNPDGVLTAGTCSRTAAVEDAHADLEYLRGLPRAGPFGYVFGVAGNVAVQGHFDRAMQMWIPAGIAGVVVSLSGPGKTAGLATGEDGAFRFDRLPPGKYQIAVAKDGYSSTGGPASVDVHAGGCAYASEGLAVDRKIAGKVTGADGWPAGNIQVEIVPFRPTPSNQLPFPVAETLTAADGTYELRHLLRGEYYLGIHLAHTPSKEMPYARYFYPGTEDPSAAAIAIVEQGPGTKTYSFSIPAPQKERRVEGFVYWPDGRPAENVEIELEDLRWPWQTSTILASTDAKGHFEISAFDRTAYRVHAITMARTASEAFSAEPLPLGPASDFDKPVRLVLTCRGHSAAELSGKGLERWRAGLGF